MLQREYCVQKLFVMYPTRRTNNSNHFCKKLQMQKTEYEKMIAGELYNAGGEQLMRMRLYKILLLFF
jgi:hypothetical protein